MLKKKWTAFAETRDDYKKEIESLRRKLPKLRALQQELVDCRGGPAYNVETPIVYNEALDEITAEDEIKLILVADNPGRREQAAENRRYLVGPSGKLAEGFFRDHEGLGIDFRKNVLILNKTPIHTPRTVELRELCRLGGPSLAAAVEASQKTMVRLLLDFYRCLAPIPIWIIGYSEMKKGGIFEVYTENLKEASGTDIPREVLFFYRHFSMNQFTVDLRKQALVGEDTAETLTRIGEAYRERILG
jgi:hypothetical protein